MNEIYLVGVVYEVLFEGIYYVCVVVYNRVFEFFKFVCLDGVIVIIVIFKVKEVVIFGVFVKGGFVIDVFKLLVWVLEDIRVWKLIDNLIKNCVYVYVFNFVMFCNLFVFMVLVYIIFYFFKLW